MATTFLFLLLSALSAVAAQQRSSHISLGSSLSPSSTNSSSWLSFSGRFAFGFYPQGNSFAIGIWFAQIPQHTVVWTRNPDDPLLSSNAMLLLANDGRFILQRTQSNQEESIADVSQSASWASMLDTGNFVLYNSSGMIIWQSIDFPTNTLLPGQRLLAGQELFSTVSETDHSAGIFRLKMQNDGNLVQYPVQTLDSPQYAYWASATNTHVKGDKVTLKLDDDGHLYLVNSTGITVLSLYKGITPINMTFYYRMTIDVDGIFRLYSIALDQKSNWSINWESSTNKCDPKGICGSNSYCTILDQRTVCNCIPGFDFINESDHSLGCQRKLNADQSCGNGTQISNYMSTLENIVWEDGPYSVLSNQTQGECEEACLAEPNCEVATFEGQECKKQKLPLGYGRRMIGTSTTTTKTFVKVRRSCSSTTPTTLLPPGLACFYVKIYM